MFTCVRNIKIFRKIKCGLVHINLKFIRIKFLSSLLWLEIRCQMTLTPLHLYMLMILHYTFFLHMISLTWEKRWILCKFLSRNTLVFCYSNNIFYLGASQCTLRHPVTGIDLLESGMEGYFLLLFLLIKPKSKNLVKRSQRMNVKPWWKVLLTSIFLSPLLSFQLLAYVDIVLCNWCCIRIHWKCVLSLFL